MVTTASFEKTSRHNIARLMPMTPQSWCTISGTRTAKLFSAGVGSHKSPNNFSSELSWAQRLSIHIGRNLNNPKTRQINYVGIYIKEIQHKGEKSHAAAPTFLFNPTNLSQLIRTINGTRFFVVVWNTWGQVL